MPRRLLIMTIVTWLFVSSHALAASPANNEGSSEKPWMGAYVGSSIPGYVVRSSFYVETSGSAKVQSGVAGEVMKKLLEDCRGGGGIALINYKSSIGIGRLPLASGDGKASIVDPGIFMHGMADCVDKADLVK
jgi:hypothetical protein